MTYKSYFLEYSSFFSLECFEGFANVTVFYHVNNESDIWAQKTVSSTTLSQKLRLILVIGNNFLFLGK